MAKDYVQKYLWRDYGKPFSTAWQITLTADEAVAFMAMVCILITYTQAKTWRLARQAVIRIIRPIQLPDNDEPNSLLRLSQYDAMSRLLSNISPWWQRRSSTSSNGMTVTSPLFGTAAIVNTAIFVVMGVLIPWLLTGGLETPVVQSKPWNGCPVSGDIIENTEYYYTPSWFTSNLNLYVSIEKYRQCWQSLSNATPGQSSCSRVDGPIVDHPQVHTTYQPTSCRVAEQTCVKNMSEFRVDHESLTLRDYGLNVESALRHSRRLTCTPLDLPVFVVENQVWGDSFRTTTDQPSRTPNLTLQSYIIDDRLECPSCEGLLEYFQRDDGDTFFVVVEKDGPNRTRRHGQVFALILDRYDRHQAFTSHRYDSIRYSSDNDYAAVMCQEQHRICLDTSPGRCTQFANISNAVEEVVEILEDRKTIKELCAFYDIFDTTTTAALLQEGEDVAVHPWSTRAPRPWTTEVIKWFEGAVLLTRANLHAVVTGRAQGVSRAINATIARRESPHIPAKYMELFCQSSLLLDSDYTNINFVGLSMALATMVAINTASHWRGHVLVARRTAGIVVAVSRIGLSFMRKFWNKVSLVWDETLSFVTSSISAIRRTQSGGHGLVTGQGSQIDLALR